MKAVDFFCGAGGVTNGLQKAGINVLAGIDIDKGCEETYTKNNSVPFLNYDISQISPRDLINKIKITVEDDNLIFVGCSPCQYFSNIKTDKTRSKKTRYLLDDFSEFILFFKPGYIFIENVPGFENNIESPISDFKKLLVKEGYVFDDRVVNAKFLGIPQNRRRYILLATRVNSQICLPKENKEKIKTVRETIGDRGIYMPVKAGVFDDTNFQHTVASLSAKNLQRIKTTPKNGGDRRSWQNNNSLQLDCYKNHSGHYDVYSRMHWDKAAPTITTRFRSISNGRYGHPEQDRAISIREGASLQSFPLDYVFHSKNLDQIGKMIGNAVPPDIAAEIGRTIIKNQRVNRKNKIKE